MMRGDGDNKAWSPGRARISRKTIAQGRPVDPVVLPRAFFAARGPWVRRAPGLPCTLCFDEGGTSATSDANGVARTLEFANVVTANELRRVGKAQACPPFIRYRRYMVGTARCAFAPRTDSPRSCPRRRGIQYAVASRWITGVSGILGRLVEPSEDERWLFDN
jgi:hypothetical protein